MWYQISYRQRLQIDFKASDFEPIFNGNIINLIESRSGTKALSQK
jgi:hypothetical protein